MYQQFVTEFALQRKDWELARGLNAKGEPMPPVKPATRSNRRSEMTPSGKGDPRAPYLMPGRGLSRTRSLLTGKSHVDYSILSWRFDAHTGDQWGKVLALHARRGKAYDVVGLSAKGKAWVAAKALASWRRWLRGAEQLPTYTPAEPMTIPLVGRTNFDYATGGIGGTVEEAKRAVAEGRGSGMLSTEEWRKYFASPRGPITPSMPGVSYSVRKGQSSVLLQHVWGGGKPVAGTTAAKAPKAPKPTPAKSIAALLPTPSPKAPPADVAAFLPPPAPTHADVLAEVRRVEFVDEAAAREWADAAYGGKDGRWWSSLDRREQGAVREYTAGLYQAVNYKHRAGTMGDGKKGDEALVDYSRKIDAALDRAAPTPGEAVLYRGVAEPRPFLRALRLKSAKELTPGFRFSDVAFTSTTISRDYAEYRGRDLKFKILVPAGAEGAWIGDNSHLPNEREFLLGRSLDAFEVVGRDGEWIVLRAFQSKGKRP